jgi:hypothetical protein
MDSSTLLQRAQEEVQADIVSDKFWMWFDPLAVYVLVGLMLFAAVVIIVSEVAGTRTTAYNDETRIGVNLMAIGIMALSFIVGCVFFVGYLESSNDYAYKVHAPDAAVHAKMVSDAYGCTR